jgi:hypothetical protein
MLFVVAGCGKQVFDGSSTGNDVQFVLDYTVLNCTKTHDMKLEKGTEVDVIIENTSGSLDILVTGSNGESIYKGDDADSGEFSIEIPEKDTYTFSVTGRKAKGSVSFKVAE